MVQLFAKTEYAGLLATGHGKLSTYFRQLTRDYTTTVQDQTKFCARISTLCVLVPRVAGESKVAVQPLGSDIFDEA